MIKLITEALSIYFWTGISLNASVVDLFCIYFNVGISCNQQNCTSSHFPRQDKWMIINLCHASTHEYLAESKVANKHFICGKFTDFRPSVTVVGATAVNDVIKRKVAHELHCESYVTIRSLKHEKTMTVGLLIVYISYSGKWHSYLILTAIRWMLI